MSGWTLRNRFWRKCAAPRQRAPRDLLNASTLPAGVVVEETTSARRARRVAWEDAAAMDDGIILAAENLTKEFRGFFAVECVNLSIRRGHIHALIGPNGAGKTTCF